MEASQVLGLCNTSSHCPISPKAMLSNGTVSVFIENFCILLLIFTHFLSLKYCIKHYLFDYSAFGAPMYCAYGKGLIDLTLVMVYRHIWPLSLMRMLMSSSR